YQLCGPRSSLAIAGRVPVPTSPAMSKPTPPIRKYMTTTPETVSPGTTIGEAAAVMREHHIRHLPVVDGQGLVQGMLSDRDVALLEGLEGLDAKSMIVAVAMSKKPYTAAPDALLTEVCAGMAEHKYGSCVIVDHGKVVGIFTAVDACRVLAEVFDTRLK
ncbi:MAG: CBS domain-containing protein, partial [Sandaracinaceae bacterium]|nr:CBS domain-containing protein [Sandaracinaceae bacterium]